MTSTVRFIAHFSINDKSEYKKYVEGFFPLLAKHGGKFLTYDDQPTVLEGEHAGGRTVMIEFESEDALMAWWNSDEYRALATSRHASTTTHSVYFIHSAQ